MTLKGEVEVDGAYFGGHVRPENRKEDRKDRRLKENQSGKRRVVVVMRERGGRTLPFVFRSEDQSVPTIRARVETGSTIYADEAPSWDDLHVRYEPRRINHSVAFVDDGVCTNQAEATSHACVAPSGASTTTSAAANSGPVPVRWRGARTTGGSRTARCSRWSRLRRWITRCRGSGRGIGSGDRRKSRSARCSQAPPGESPSRALKPGTSSPKPQRRGCFAIRA